MLLFDRWEIVENCRNVQVSFIRDVVVNDDNPCVLLSDDFDFIFDCADPQAHTQFFRRSRQRSQLET